jgi:hypothetical protein
LVFDQFGQSGTSAEERVTTTRTVPGATLPAVTGGVADISTPCFAAALGNRAVDRCIGEGTAIIDGNPVAKAQFHGFKPFGNTVLFEGRDPSETPSTLTSSA